MEPLCGALAFGTVDTRHDAVLFYAVLCHFSHEVEDLRNKVSSFGDVLRHRDVWRVASLFRHLSNWRHGMERRRQKR